MSYQPTSYFAQNSFFDSPRAEAESELSELPSTHMLAGVERSAPIKSEPDVTNKQLEDWSHRIEAAANEAGDAHLLALESDLFDLRDEIVHVLHQRLL